MANYTPNEIAVSS